MISQDQFSVLTKAHPSIGKMTDKVQDIIRDELEPDMEVHYSQSVKVGGADGVVFTTSKHLYAFWTMKMMIFFKLPTTQEFNLSQIRKVEANGASVYVRAEADPSLPDDDYEENNFTFASSKEAQEFSETLKATAEV